MLSFNCKFRDANPFYKKDLLEVTATASKSQEFARFQAARIREKRPLDSVQFRPVQRDKTVVPNVT
jgi:hypothetical protein